VHTDVGDLAAQREADVAHDEVPWYCQMYNKHDAQGYTPLALAAKLGSLRMFNHLLGKLMKVGSSSTQEYIETLHLC
jgi:hypothetical protein